MGKRQGLVINVGASLDWLNAAAAQVGRLPDRNMIGNVCALVANEDVSVAISGSSSERGKLEKQAKEGKNLLDRSIPDCSVSEVK